MLPAPVSVDAIDTTQNEDDSEERARLQEEDRLLLLEVGSLNGAGKPSQMPKASNRISPMG
jgi:hypothetical protein